MKKRIGSSAGLLAAALLSWFSSLHGAVANEGIQWNSSGDVVDAQIEGWPLPKVLGAIATSTGWQIYVEPDTRHTVSTRFRKLKPAEALRRLLGELNFALLPQTNGPAKFFVYRTTVQEATQLVAVPSAGKLKAPSAKPIPNELIVTLKRGAKQSIDQIAKKLGAKVVGRIDERNAYRLHFDDAAAARNAQSLLEDDGDIASTEDNFSVAAPAQLQPLAMNSAPPPSFKLNPAAGSDKLIIALVDTPVQAHGAPWADFLLPAVSLAGDAALDPERLTHGTAMMDTIWASLGRTLKDPGSASVSFLTLDVYGNSSATTMFDVARAIVEAVNKGARIVNLSLGGYGDSPFLHDVLAQARTQGVLLVAAAGNEPVTTPTLPASDPNVLSVTSGTRNGGIASYANRSDSVDVIAPGASVVFFNGRAYLVTGTSAAAANASGAAGGLAINNHQSTIDAGSQVAKLPGFAPATKR